MSLNNVDFKVLSSLEKCFLTDDLSQKAECKRLSMLKNEKASFQLAYTTRDGISDTTFITLELEGELKDSITVQRVMHVPCVYPAYTDRGDDYYLKKEPGLYPDLLLPVSYNGRLNLVQNSLLSLWGDIALSDNVLPGSYKVGFVLKDSEGNALARAELEVEVIAALLPDFGAHHTEWFHTDCLAEYYNVEPFSEEHWRIVEQFIKTAAENEINISFIPLITPALDTYVGGERKTTQLVDIFIEDGKYRFGFSNVERWVKLCKRHGITKFEVPPLFTQWGAKHAPKIMAWDDYGYKQIFGWETDSDSEEYIDFLKHFIPEMLKEFERLGISRDDCFFHISDEPDLKDLEMYNKTFGVVKELLQDYTIIDAMWKTEIYKAGCITTPVVSVGAVDAFKREGAENYWIYYCGGHCTDVSNRYLSMPLARTRIIGVQMYKDGALGFLHWGYNYYHNRYSYATVNPYLETSGEYFAPAGDTFIVYPGENGKACESVRLKAMRDAMQDIKALRLCESLYGREYVISLIQDGLDYELDYKHYPHCDCYLQNLRERVNKAIALKMADCEAGE